MAIWDKIERQDEDISTERLCTLTSQRMTEWGRHATEGQVVDVLEAGHLQKTLPEKAPPPSSPG